MKNKDYEIFGISLENIRNKNETKVIEIMNKLIPEFPEFDYCSICIQDVYALSLNLLSPKYTQAGTVVLKKELSHEDFRDVVESAIEKVAKHPNHST